MSSHLGQKQQGTGSGILWVLAVVVGIGLLSQCDRDTGVGPTHNTAAASDFVPDMNVATIADAVSINPPSKAAAILAAKNLRLALDAEGFAGAMIYSQNCFASVRIRFSWEKLDHCAAFDALAGLGAGNVILAGTEQKYFSDAAAKQRYVVAAASSGVEMTAQEEHFAALRTVALERVPDLQITTRATSVANSVNQGVAITDREADLNDVAAEDASTIRIACASERGQGPAIYNACIRRHFDAVLSGENHPDFSAIEDEDASTIRITCAFERGEGPLMYNECLRKHLRGVVAGDRHPDLSAIGSDDASTIRITCAAKRGEGPASYNACLRRHLRDVTTANQ